MPLVHEMPAPASRATPLKHAMYFFFFLAPIRGSSPPFYPRPTPPPPHLTIPFPTSFPPSFFSSLFISFVLFAPMLQFGLFADRHSPHTESLLLQLLEYRPRSLVSDCAGTSTRDEIRYRRPAVITLARRIHHRVPCPGRMFRPYGRN